MPVESSQPKTRDKKVFCKSSLLDTDGDRNPRQAKSAQNIAGDQHEMKI